jgi:3-deoxy-D-manno-octulosonic-acid transferase
MIRALYAALWMLVAPLAVARLAWRARRQPGYLQDLAERFGRYRQGGPGPWIWIHAVSVGETRAAALLASALMARFPGHRLLLTHMTPTGRATGIELFGDGAERAWLPYDMAFAVRGFVRHYRPRVGVIMETEVWPRLLEETRRAGVPTVLANARLSERSRRRYARLPRLSTWAFSNLDGVAAQTGADARRFEELGAAPVAVLGNVKFDLTVPPAMESLARELRARWGASRPVWVAGSTREGEEELLLDAFARMPPGPVLVLVPRHPHRFDAVASMAAARGLEAARRSAGKFLPQGVRVVIGDSMGEMLAYYGAADVVVMGGSLLEYGSQNLIEACAMGKPVIVGPHTFNFEEAADGAIAAGAALRVGDAAAALDLAASLSADRMRREAMGEAAAAFVATHRGAVERLADWIAARAGA